MNSAGLGFLVLLGLGLAVTGRHGAGVAPRRDLPPGPLEPASGPGTPGTVVVPKGRKFKTVSTTPDGRSVESVYTYDFDHAATVNTPQESFWEPGVLITQKIILF